MIKLIILDIDGVFTDGKLIMSENGEESKSISFKDIDAYFALKKAGIKSAFITGEATPIVEWFKKRFDPDCFVSGCKDKAAAITDLAHHEGITKTEICFVGDSVHDVPGLESVGLSVCPSNASDDVKSRCSLVLHASGGNGAVAEIASIILSGNTLGYLARRSYTVDPSSVLALIPARGGSKTIPKKNIMLLGGHPLLAYSIAAARGARLVTEIIVSTDSEEVADVAHKYGADVPFLRPKELSGDNSTDIEFVLHCLDFLHEKRDKVPDLVVHLRPTTPLRNINVIDAAISYMQANPSATSLRSMQCTGITPYKLFRKDGETAVPFLRLPGFTESYNLPRQYFTQAYLPNGYIDILRSDLVGKLSLLHGSAMKLWETDAVADIDELSDYEHAQQLLTDPQFANLLTLLDKIS